MTNKTYCDRCKKEILNYNERGILIKIGEDIFYNERDICPDCIEDFQKVFKKTETRYGWTISF